MHKFERRKRVEERLNDQQAVRRGEFRAVGDFVPVWIDTVEITEEFRDGNWHTVIENKKLLEKRLKSHRVNVKVGDSIMGVRVTQIDPEWVKKEREILENWKKNEKSN